MNNLIRDFKKSGFTLLEVLLVIAIMGTLATIAITAYQKYSTQGKLNMAAQQMQSMMEAASAFYVSGLNANAKNHWPAMSGSTAVMPDDFLPFLSIKYNSAKMTTNPWGYAYYIDGSNDYKFKIQTYTKTPEMAKRLAGMLPFATVDPPGSTIITSYIPVPGQGFPTGVIPIAIGSAKDDQVISQLASCPTGMTMAAQTAINSVRTDLSDVSTWWGPNIIIASPFSILASSRTLDTNKKTLTISTSLKKAGDCSLPDECLGIAWGGNCDYKKHCKDKNQGADPNPWNGEKVRANAFYIVYCYFPKPS